MRSVENPLVRRYAEDANWQIVDRSDVTTAYAALVNRSEATPGGAAVADPDTVTVENSSDRPWITIVWDDPVNLMRYVSYVFQKVLGHTEANAQKLMMQVHTEGKAVVSSGDRDKVEADVRKLQAAGLWATMSQDS